RETREAAGQRPGIRFLSADATSLPFDDGYFDIVATNKTTHHIPNWKQAVNEMIRVLKTRWVLDLHRPCAANDDCRVGRTPCRKARRLSYQARTSGDRVRC